METKINVNFQKIIRITLFVCVIFALPLYIVIAILGILCEKYNVNMSFMDSIYNFLQDEFDPPSKK